MAAMGRARKTRTVSFTSGKGGVGKTTMTAHFAHYLALKGKRVLVFDGDLGMANVEIFFGTKPNGNLMEVLNGQKSIQEIITPVGPNISLISGGTGLVELNRLDAFQRRGLVDAVSALESVYDYVLIDTAPGISDNVLSLNSAAQEVVLIVTPDAASVTDAYALMKVLNQEYKEERFTVLCNSVRDEAEGLSLFKRISDVANRFLPISLDYAGSIPGDPLYKRSSQQQRLILKHEVNSQAAQILNQIFTKLDKTLENTKEKGGIQFFWEQVAGVA